MAMKNGAIQNVTTAFISCARKKYTSLQIMIVKILYYSKYPFDWLNKLDICILNDSFVIDKS